MTTTLDVLLKLEAEYLAAIEKHTQALQGVRFAIASERGERPPADAIVDASIHSYAEIRDHWNGSWLAGLSNNEAIQRVLEVNSPGMTRGEILKALHAGGHSIASSQALSVALSTSDLFENRDGKWYLNKTVKPVVPSNGFYGGGEGIVSVPYSAVKNYVDLIGGTVSKKGTFSKHIFSARDIAETVRMHLHPSNLSGEPTD